MGKLLVVVLAPLRFPVLQVFPGIFQTASLSITWQKRFLFHYSYCNFYKKNKTTKNLVQRSGGRFFRLWGMRMLRICGDVVLPKVTLNPIDSHKPMYYKVNNDHHGDYYPLDIKVNNDHHGDPLPLGHYSKQ